MSARGARRPYLLGDDRREVARLRAQARLWDPVSHALFDRVGVRRGWKVLEIGPGPGSLHRELRRRVRGPVDAIEPSATFARRLRTQWSQDGLGPGRLWTEPLHEVALPAAAYDLIFARWVFLFLPDPLAHLRRLVRALRPGGRLALQDYLRDTFALVPLPREWSAFLAADAAFFASQGGDVNVGARLPELYRRAGLAVESVTPTVWTGRPGSPVWRWLSTYCLGIMDRYAGGRPSRAAGAPTFTREQARSLTRAWLAAERDPVSVIVAPAVLDVVGRKPRR